MLPQGVSRPAAVPRHSGILVSGQESFSEGAALPGVVLDGREAGDTPSGGAAAGVDALLANPGRAAISEVAASDPDALWAGEYSFLG